VLEGAELPTTLRVDQTYLWDKHRILVASIVRKDFNGVRVTPNLYTTLQELDYFCEVMEHVAKNGLPKSA